MDIPSQWIEHRTVWHDKPVLRTIYHDFYRRIGEWLVSGPTLELGCGCGNFKEFLSSAIALDIVPAPWLDAVADAHALPFADESVSNIVLIDVIHHLAEPRRFLGEAERVLTPGGRLLLIEPAITVASWFFYRFLHPERVDFSVDPLTDVDEGSKKDPYDGNQAIPTILFTGNDKRLREATPMLTLQHRSYLSLCAYPLSGGFRRWSLVPNALARPLLKLESGLTPAIGRWTAFRLFVVMERFKRT